TQHLAEHLGVENELVDILGRHESEHDLVGPRGALARVGGGFATRRAGTECEDGRESERRNRKGLLHSFSELCECDSSAPPADRMRLVGVSYATLEPRLTAHKHRVDESRNCPVRGWMRCAREAR